MSKKTMTFEELSEITVNAPVKLADGKFGLLIRWYQDTESVGVQVPGEEHIRGIPALHLRDLGNGALEEVRENEKNCAFCGHPSDWHRHDDGKCLSTHPQPCSLPGTLDAQRGAPLAPFRCLGYNCDGGGFPGGTPETRCGCPDFIEATS